MTTSILQRGRRLLLLPIDHPIATTFIAFVVALAAALSVSRVHADASLEAMFTRQSDAGAALSHVLHDFDAVDDLLVLVTLPKGQNKPDVDRLLAFAQRFSDDLARSNEPSKLIDGVIYRADAQTREFFQNVLVPSAIFYLDDATFSAAMDRLTRRQMQAQVERDVSMMSTPGPAAGTLAKAFMQDPLRLHEFVLDRLKSQAPFHTYQGSDAYLSEDGTSLLIRVRGKHPPDDLHYCQALMTAATNGAKRANSDHLDVQFAGSYAIAAESGKSIRADMIGSVTGSVICLQILFLIVYRGSLKLFLVALAPIALGVLLGFGVYAIFNNALTPLTAVLGGILAGMAIDYSIQYLSMYESLRGRGAAPLEAARQATLDITPAAFAAWATSVLGFLAIAASTVPMLRSFSILGSIGLGGAFVSVVALGPMLLARTDRRLKIPIHSRFRFTTVPMLNVIGGRARWFVSVAIAVVILSVVALFIPHRPLLPFESDLTAMHPRPNPALAAQDEIARRFGVAPDSIVVYLHADSSQKLLALAHDVTARLSTDAAREAGLVGTYGLATLLPDPRIEKSRVTSIGAQHADTVTKDFRGVMSDAGFDVDAKPLREYGEFLRVLLTRTSAPGIKNLVPYRELARTMLPRSAFAGSSGNEAITLVFMQNSFNDRAQRDRAVVGIRQALSGLGGATPTGLTVLAYDTELSVRRELPRLAWIAIIAAGLYMAIHFRSATDALQALLPTAFSLLVLLALMHLFGQKLNMINLVAVPLLIGIDVDYGIFLVSLARQKQVRTLSRKQLIDRLSPVVHAVLMCGMATIIGFGSLAWTSVPAVRSLGIAVAVGIAGCLFCAMFLLVPIFFLMARNDSGES